MDGKGVNYFFIKIRNILGQMEEFMKESIKKIKNM